MESLKSCVIYPVPQGELVKEPGGPQLPITSETAHFLLTSKLAAPVCYSAGTNFTESTKVFWCKAVVSESRCGF